MGKHTQRTMTHKGMALRPRLAKTILGGCLLFMGLVTTIDKTIHAAPQSSLSLLIHNQQFSVNIIRIPLEQVLQTISSYGPIRFVIKGDLENDQISSSFHHLSLEESIEKILVHYDFAIIHHQINAEQNTSEFPHLTEVVILSRNHPEMLSDSIENVVIAPSRNSSPPERIVSTSSLESSDWLRAFEIGSGMNPQESLEEIEESIQDTDPESLVLIKKLLEE